MKTYEVTLDSQIRSHHTVTAESQEDAVTEAITHLEYELIPAELIAVNRVDIAGV